MYKCLNRHIKRGISIIRKPVFRWMLPLLLALIQLTCIDPVSPDFEYRTGLVFIEGFASTADGASSVTIRESAIEFGVYVVNIISGAQVSLVEEATERVVGFMELEDSYVPPADFVVSPGESWLLDIRLQDGTHYKSTYEPVSDPVPISNIRAEYKPRLFYREASERFVPGHEIIIDFDDPGEVDNYYYWGYRSFENLENCEKCIFGIFRDGECISPYQGTNVDNYYDYKCESTCWKIRYPEELRILDDRLSNGQSLTSQAVANIPLYTREDTVVELQQLSLTPTAYEYYRVLKDLVDNNSGLNAPPPAALIGNITNMNDGNDVVFGRFTAAATTTAHVFIARNGIAEEPVERFMSISREGCEVCPPGSSCPLDCSPVTTAACSETRYRTAVKPPIWPDS